MKIRSGSEHLTFVHCKYFVQDLLLDCFRFLLETFRFLFTSNILARVLGESDVLCVDHATHRSSMPAALMMFTKYFNTINNGTENTSPEYVHKIL